MSEEKKHSCKPRAVWIGEFYALMTISSKNKFVHKFLGGFPSSYLFYAYVSGVIIVRTWLLLLWTPLFYT